MTCKPVPFYAEAGTSGCPHGTDGDHDRHEPCGEFWICRDVYVGDGCDTHTDEWGNDVFWGDCLDRNGSTS